MELTERDLKEIFAHAEEGYPDEVCGIVIGRPGNPAMNVVRRCENLANQYHQEDPVRHPRDARTAYVMDPKGLLRIQTEADAEGLEFIVIYHSHTDHDAYFSRTDRDEALFDGEPLWPGARYLVVSVRTGKILNFKVFTWNSITKNFEEIQSPVLRGN